MKKNRVSPLAFAPPRITLLAATCLGMALAMSACSNNSGSSTATTTTPLSPQDSLATATPIKHLVVIYNENVSFDHYFGSYPYATNPAGEPAFTAAASTPTDINNLIAPGTSLNNSPLVNNNPNYTNTANGTGAANPFRLDRTQAGTADQNHNYTAEQLAYDNGMADLFPLHTGTAGTGGSGAFDTKGLVMGYYDGNTLQSYWNYAQHFAMSDNAYTSSYGPSTPGALNVVSGQTNGVVLSNPSTVPTATTSASFIADGQGGITETNDADPTGDVCSTTTGQTSQLTGKNIGDLLNAANITWGGFMGGFNLTLTNANGTTGCKRSTMPVATTPDGTEGDYIQHHNWFQYYASTSNFTHARPSTTAAIGYSLEADGKTPEPANHEYDVQDFVAAVQAGNFPSVSYLKAPAYEDGHAGYSDPVDEQTFATNIINFLQQQPDWQNTAVVITYDDSDGWYDHAYTTPTRGSFNTTVDQVNGAGVCGTATNQPTNAAGLPVNGRCGPGTRIPFMVVSPWAKANYVDHTLIDQSSVIRFIEDNWLGGQRIGGGSFDATAGNMMGLFNFSGSGSGNNATLFLDPSQGTPVSTPPALPALL